MRRYIILCCRDHYNILGIVRTLGEAGINPVLVTVEGAPYFGAKSKYVSDVIKVHNLNEGINFILRNYMTTVMKPEKSYILAGDDKTIAALDERYEDLKDHFIFYNSRGNLRKVMDKEYQSKVAEKYGFKPIKTWRVHTRKNEIPEDIVYPVITKTANSYGDEWKGAMFVCHDEMDLIRAYDKIKTDEILLQEFVHKQDEQSYSGISSEHGREVMVAHRNNQLYNLDGHYTPAWRLSQPTYADAKVISNIKKIIKDFGFEGIFEFEFIKDLNGDLRLLEVNLRNTVLGYASTVYGLPLVTLWCSAMTDGMSHVRTLKKEAESGLEDIKAISECYDFDLMKKGQHVCTNKKQWVKFYKSCKAKLYRGRDDFKPFLSFMIYKKLHHV